MTVSVVLLFLAVPWVGLQCVIVVLPDHAHLFFFHYCMQATKARTSLSNQRIFIHLVECIISTVAACNMSIF